MSDGAPSYTFTLNWDYIANFDMETHFLSDMPNKILHNLIYFLKEYLMFSSLTKF